MTGPVFTRARIADHAEDQVELVGGAWRFDPWKRVQVWVVDPNHVATPAPRCPKCGATRDEPCRTARGISTANHRSRGFDRICPCGQSLRPQRRFCDECGTTRANASRRESRVRQAA